MFIYGTSKIQVCLELNSNFGNVWLEPKLMTKLRMLNIYIQSLWPSYVWPKHIYKPEIESFTKTWNRTEPKPNRLQKPETEPNRNWTVYKNLKPNRLQNPKTELNRLQKTCDRTV